MSIRVRVAKGVLVPVDPLPKVLEDGMEFEVETPPDFSLNGHAAADPVNDADECTEGLTDEEERALQAFLNESRKLGKEHMRKIMDLLR